MNQAYKDSVVAAFESITRWVDAESKRITLLEDKVQELQDKLKDKESRE